MLGKNMNLEVEIRLSMRLSVSIEKALTFGLYVNYSNSLRSLVSVRVIVFGLYSIFDKILA